MQLNLFEIPPSSCDTDSKSYVNPSTNQMRYDLFQAYYDARRNKRNTISQLAFETNYESNLLQLYEEIIMRTYQIKPGVCFINFDPVTLLFPKL